jgi:hypothetical protein
MGWPLDFLEIEENGVCETFGESSLVSISSSSPQFDLFAVVTFGINLIEGYLISHSLSGDATRTSYHYIFEVV